MEFGLFTSGYQYDRLEQAFADAKRFGYDYIELWGGRPHAYAPDLARGELNQILSLIETYEIPVRVYTPEHNAYPYNFMLGSELQRGDALDYLKLCMDMGKAMGAEYTLISTGHGGYVATKREKEERLIRSLEELADHAQSIGHKLLLEALTHCETNLCTTADGLADVLTQVNSPALLGMCDVVPPFVEREPVTGYFRHLGHRMAHLHLVDSDGSSETHLLPGDGNLPIAELLDEIQELGYQGRCTIELVTAYLQDPSLYAKRAITRVKALCTKG